MVQESNLASLFHMDIKIVIEYENANEADLLCVHRRSLTYTEQKIAKPQDFDQIILHGKRISSVMKNSKHFDCRPLHGRSSRLAKYPYIQ